jgi:phosphatidylethanolamine/phosphatidyl-N-methylethanolamine N-methyltransferase
VVSSAKGASKFFIEFVRAPNVTGAVAPSSRFLAKTVVDWIDWSATDCLLEWGPGTGAFTEAILARRPASCHYMAIEVNPEMCRLLRIRFPGIQVFQESVVKVGEVCRQECVEAVDCVVSGLPWAAFAESQQDELLEAMMGVLKRGGQFTTFAYVHGLAIPPGRAFRRKLHYYFSSVTLSPVVWANMPPAIVYRCRR